MADSSRSSVLKDVVAFVDVWSSNKRANYSQTFVQQLEEMGAQVSKRFNKRVTHVVFGNGHSSTWRNAKKRDTRLVSVLWVQRCYQDGVHANEELFPALNDESDPILKNRKHRCMLPKNTPDKTTKNDWRMKKKLELMMQSFPPKTPIVSDFSPIIIDHESGIIYSPGLKRSEYMAQRLKEMQDKRENPSPIASPTAESSTSNELKPSLGITPSVFGDMSDLQTVGDSNGDVPQLGSSPNKDGKKHLDFEESEPVKPVLTCCRDSTERITTVPEYMDTNHQMNAEGNKQTTLEGTLVKKKATKKSKSDDLSQISLQVNSDQNKKLNQESEQSTTKSGCEREKQTNGNSFTDTKSCDSPNAGNALNLSSSDMLVDAVSELGIKSPRVSKNIEMKTPKNTRTSLSSVVRSFSLCKSSKSVACKSSDGDDSFEDYFSPSNNKSLLPKLSLGSNIKISFELDSSLNKRKQKRRESCGSDANEEKKPKLDKNHCDMNDHQEPHKNNTAAGFQISRTALEISTNNVTNNKHRHSSLAFANIGKTTRKRRTTSTPRHPLLETGAAETLENPKTLDFMVLSKTLQSGGNECTVAAVCTETLSEDNLQKNTSLKSKTMVNKTKTRRTLVMTSMPTEKQNTVVQVVKALGGFSIVDEVCESTTHVVSGEPKRTLNILLGIARGCWILSFEWILWSLEQRRWIPEEPYELYEQFPAAQICRLQRHLSAGEHQQDLFQGQPAIFVSQHAQPPTRSLVELIELCGGTVCKTVRQAGICIGKYNGRRREGIRILSEHWILDCISNLKILPYEDYELK